MNFKDIPQFPQAHYQINVSWRYLQDWLEGEKEITDLDPDYQRDHVWTTEQQINYVEYILKGGEGGRILYWNCPNWPAVRGGERLELVDGKQRLTAVLAFLNEEIRAFGLYFSEFEGKLNITGTDFVFKVAKLETKTDILSWYLGINAGGTPHSSDELNRVRGLLEKEEANE